MINLNETMIMPMNIFAIIMCIAFMIVGYQKGVIRSILSLIGTALSFYVAWLLSDPLAKHLALYKPELNEAVISTFVNAGSYLANRIIWFLICFICARVLLFLVDKIFKGIHEIPGFHLVGGILGAVFGIAETVIWLLVICVALETPLFTNGSLVINESVLGIVRDKAEEVFGDFVSVNEGADLFSSLKDNMDEISEEQVNAFEAWLLENDFQIGEGQ